MPINLLLTFNDEKIEGDHEERTILIVDDEVKNVRLLKAILTKENFNLVSSLNGDALKIVISNSVDLVLLDIMMMGMNGYTVCEKIKNNEKTRNIPILMLSVLTGKEDRRKAMKAGADYFMSKPVVRNELLDRIHSLLSHDNRIGPSRTDSCGNC
jgi:CheY-like chemotaxis protein